MSTVESYMKEYDTEHGLYVPKSMYSRYQAPGGPLFYAWIPEVCVLCSFFNCM